METRNSTLRLRIIRWKKARTAKAARERDAYLAQLEHLGVANRQFVFGRGSYVVFAKREN